MARRIYTIEDLERETYGFLHRELRKDSDVTTGDTAAYNAIFGAKLWVGATTEFSVFAALPKKPYEKAGYRFISVLSDTTGGGVTEGAAIPATTEPTFLEIEVGLKEMVISFAMSARMLAIAGKDDVATWDELREVQGRTFNKLVNYNLMVTNDTTAPGSTTAIETLDRVVSSTASDVTGCGHTAGDEDYAGHDRSTTTTVFDGYVNHNGSGGTETDRSLTLALIDSLEQNTRKFWDNPAAIDNKIYITGYDTLYRWSQLLQAGQRFDTTRIRTTVNGVDVVGQNEAGFTVNLYNGIPIIPNDDSTSDTIKRVYLIDLDHTWVAVAKPTQYLESEDYLAIDKLGREGVFYLMGELVCTNPRTCGKLRGLK